MVKIRFEYLLIALFLFGVLAQSVKADTVTLSINPKLDYSFTTKNNLTFSNNQFVFNNIRLTPEFSVNNVVRNLSVVTFNTQIKDEKYRYKFGFNITKPITSARLDYIMFKIPFGCSKNTDTSLKCGKNEIDFIDIVESGYTINITNDIINITGGKLGNSIISLDPTIQMLPNSTNKAWLNTTSLTTNCLATAWTTLTEFTSTEYGKVNVSDNIWYSLGATSSTFDLKCTMDKFTFNVSAVVADLNTITEIKIVHEGYYSSTAESWGDLWWYNGTSGLWTVISDLNYGSDSIISKTFTETSILSNGIATFGVKSHCILKNPVQSRTDIAYLNVTYTGEEPEPTKTDGDPLYCSISPMVGVGISPVVLCMPRSNVTGQPLTSATINCQVQLGSGAYTGGVQASSAMTEQTNGLYNYTIQNTSLSANTLYTVNCTTAITGVNNNFGAIFYVMPDFATNITSVNTSVNNLGVNISDLNTTLIALGVNTSNIYDVLIALGINSSTINETCNLGFANATDNFTNIENLINALNDASAQDIWEYVLRDANCSNCTGEGSNTTYNNTFNTNNYLNLDRTQLRNISKAVWELAPEDVNNLYVLIILVFVIITLCILVVVSYKRRWLS